MERGTTEDGFAGEVVSSKNPWLIGALVSVLPVVGSIDSNLKGTIEDVRSGPRPKVGQKKLRIVTVRLKDGRVIEFLSTQLVLV